MHLLNTKQKAAAGSKSGAACLLVVAEKRGYCGRRRENKSVTFFLSFSIRTISYI